MEMDGAVVLGFVAPAHLLARPVMALHASRRQIDGLPVETVGREVAQKLTADVLREVPSSDQRWLQIVR